jgi:hypothetical protein
LSGYVLAGVVAGLLLTAVHVVASMQAGRSPNFETATQLILSGVGVGTGLKVLKICITADTLRPFSDGDRVYILLGGFALIWISVSTIAKKLSPKENDA